MIFFVDERENKIGCRKVWQRDRLFFQLYIWCRKGWQGKKLYLQVGEWKKVELSVGFTVFVHLDGRIVKNSANVVYLKFCR